MRVFKLYDILDRPSDRQCAFTIPLSGCMDKRSCYKCQKCGGNEVSHLCPMIQCRQNTPNSCCFSSLESVFESVNQIKAAHAISKCTEEPLTSQVSLGIILILQMIF